MNQSSSTASTQPQQHEYDQLSGGQSLEIGAEELQYFDWGDNNESIATSAATAVVGTSDGAPASVGVVGPPPAAFGHQTSSSLDNLDPLPYSSSPSHGGSHVSFFGFSRVWGMGGYGNGVTPMAASTTPVIASPLPPLPDVKVAVDEQPPGMVRSSDSGSESSDTLDDDDEIMSTDDEASEVEGGEADSIASTNNKGVTFNEQVRVLPIPPISAYTSEQRFRMYANRFELRENKMRNKKEYEFDGYDWRNATEEHSMAICPMSGELLHPAHL